MIIWRGKATFSTSLAKRSSIAVGES